MAKAHIIQRKDRFHVITYDGSDSICSTDARLLIVESVVFGRTEMGERDIAPRFHDRWRIRRDGRP